MNKLSIKWKLLIPAQVGLAVFVTLITLFWSSLLSDNLRHAFDEQFSFAQKTAAKTSADLIWDFNQEAAQTALESLAELRGFTFARIVSEGSTFAETSLAEEWEPAWDEMIDSAQADDLESITVDRLIMGRTPIMRSDNTIGHIFAAYDLSYLDNIIHENNLRAAYIGVIAFAVFAVTLYFVTLSISRPINSVITQLQRLQDGTTEIELPEAARGDEIGLLGKAVITVRDSMIAREVAENKRIEAERLQQGEAEARRQQEREHDAAVKQAQVEKEARERQRAAEEAEKEARRRAQQDEMNRQQAHVVETLGVALEALSRGDLSKRISTPFPEEYEKLRMDYNNAVESLDNTVAEVVDHAEQLSNAAREIAAASDDLAVRTEKQAASLEEVAAAINELTASVENAARLAQDAKNNSAETQVTAEQGGNVSQQAVEAMERISTSSDKIFNITALIEEIAFQTNLLALNAGVEAARAGEAGSGFAVVATEVRNLSQRSSGAANEIRDLIEKSSKEVTNGVTLVANTREALKTIFASIAEITNNSTESADISSGQSDSIQEINSAITTLDQFTQRNAAMFEETTAATHVVTRDAQALSKSVSKFTLTRHAEASIDTKQAQAGKVGESLASARVA